MIVSAVVVVVAVALLLAAELRDDAGGRWTWKPLASSGFVAFALAAGALDSPFGIAVLVALVLSWWGDLLLIPKAQRAFMAGVLAFLLGHVAFGVAFVLAGVAWPWTTFALAILALPALLVARTLLPRAPASLRGPLLAYISVISAMVALAVGSVVAGTGPLALLAALAFYLSDLAVARDRFLAPGFANRAVGLPLYYGAQVAFGICAWQAAAA